MDEQNQNIITASDLEPKQLAFAEYLLQGKTQREAYKLAGYKAVRGEDADSSASRIASNVKVSAYIQYRRNEIILRAQYTTGVTVERTMKELERISFFDPAKLYDENGNLKNIPDMDEDVRRAIAGIDVMEEYEGTGKDRKFIGYTKKIRFWNKVEANKELCKIQGMYAPQRHEVAGEINVKVVERKESEIEQELEKILASNNIEKSNKANVKV